MRSCPKGDVDGVPQYLSVYTPFNVLKTDIQCINNLHFDDFLPVIVEENQIEPIILKPDISVP